MSNRGCLDIRKRRTRCSYQIDETVQYWIVSIMKLSRFIIKMWRKRSKESIYCKIDPEKNEGNLKL